jgi:hypothetical protein
MDLEKRIAEIYCSNPAAVSSLFINGKFYSKDELRTIAEKYLKESDCSCVDLLGNEDLNDRLDRNIHKKMMGSFRSNIKNFKDKL